MCMELLVAPASRRLSDAAVADGVVFADPETLGIVLTRAEALDKRSGR